MWWFIFIVVFSLAEHPHISVIRSCACVMYREQGLVRVDHELHHADDSSAVLHSCRALHAELLLWALLLVQQVRPEYGGQVQRRHLITNHLQYSRNNTNTAIISNCIDLSELVGLWWSWKTTHDLQNLPYRDFYCAFVLFVVWQMWSAWCFMEKIMEGRKDSFFI